MIIPPPELRKVIDKTASFVVKNGREFEEKIRLKERGNSKFSFLNLNDPYHSYFLKVLEEPADIYQSSEQPAESPAAVHPDDLAADENEAPELPLRYLSKLDASIALVDLLLLKLAARYTARNGHACMVALFHRESTNPQFEFLKPLHANNSSFKQITSQYETILSGESSSSIRAFPSKWDLLAKLQVSAHHQMQRKRLKFEADLSGKTQHQAYNNVHWNEFALLDFYDPFADNALSAAKPLKHDALSKMSISARSSLWAGQ